MNSETGAQREVQRFLVVEVTTGRGLFAVDARDAQEAAGRALIVAQLNGLPLPDGQWQVHPAQSNAPARVAQFAEGYFRMLADAARAAALRGH